MLESGSLYRTDKRLVRRGFMYPTEIPIAEESDQSDGHERREKKLPSGDDEPRREEQQSDRRKEGQTCEARAAPCEDSGDGVRTAPHQG